MVDNSNHLYECLKDRIAFILEKEHQTVGAFASKIGVQWQTARNIVVGRNKPGAELLLKIVNAYDWVSADWLWTGEEPQGEINKKLVDVIQKQSDTINELSKRLADEASKKKN